MKGSFLRQAKRRGARIFVLATIVLFPLAAPAFAAAPPNDLLVNCATFISNIKSAMTYGAASSLAAMKKTNSSIVMRDAYCFGKLEEMFLDPDKIKHPTGTGALTTCSATTCVALPTVAAADLSFSQFCNQTLPTATGAVKIVMPTNALSVFQTLGKTNANRTSDYSNYVFTYEGK